MVLRRARPPRTEANHEGTLRSGVPRGGVTYPRSGWFCAGPGPLGERQSRRHAAIRGAARSRNCVLRWEHVKYRVLGLPGLEKTLVRPHNSVNYVVLRSLKQQNTVNYSVLWLARGILRQGRSGAPSGRFSGAFWGSHGEPWGAPGDSWGCLEASWVSPGASRAAPGRLLGIVLGPPRG